MPETVLLSEFMRGAVGGVSRAQLTRTFKEQYNWTDQEIESAIQLCQFKTKPKQIDYLSFYNLPVTKKAKRIPFPFTQIYTLDNFLTEDECQNLIEIIDQNLRPSTVSDPKDSCTVSDYRTSKTADLHYFGDPFFLSIDRKITDLLEVSPFLGETMQAQRYEPGQYYKEHWDFFSPTTKEYKVYCDWMGQRTWTTMIYLNDVAEGGETYFKHLKLRLKPKQGTLVAWNNLYKNGIPNPKTMHEACPPISGNKYVITKWWRSWALI
jgi:prolyl 4-hydroxylase